MKEELLINIKALLSVGFNHDTDVFGVYHNLATDVLSEIEVLLEATDKCIVHGCENHKGQGSFEGDICVPCYELITTGELTYGTCFVYQLNALLSARERQTELLRVDNSKQRQLLDEARDILDGLPRVPPYLSNWYIDVDDFLRLCNRRINERSTIMDVTAILIHGVYNIRL